MIGIAFVGAAVSLGEFLSSLLGTQSHGRVPTGSLAILGRVARWRPTEIFLHDRWPIRTEARMFGRLAAIDVSLCDGTPHAVTPA